MKEVVLSPYVAACPTPEKDTDRIFGGASSVPGSRTLKYLPSILPSYKYGIKHDCGIAFKMPIVWKSEPKNTELYRTISHQLVSLPLSKGSKVMYMPTSEGYFFDLKLDGGVHITITQYEDESDKGAYINVSLEGEVLIQDFMSIDDMVSAMKEYYHGGES